MEIFGEIWKSKVDNVDDHKKTVADSERFKVWSDASVVSQNIAVCFYDCLKLNFAFVD